MTSAHRPSRRTVLVTAALALPALAFLDGCASEGADGAYGDVDPVRVQTLGDELALVAAYRQAIGAHPTLAAQLQPILDQHLAHADALRDSSTVPSGQANPLASASPSGTPVAVAGASDAEVLASLQEAERAAAALRAGACVRASAQPLASLLVLIGASEAQHVVALGGSAA
ncbi:MAG: hypothetical protein ACH36H_03565 [Candidatus Nanopelagicales bacterium]